MNIVSISLAKIPNMYVLYFLCCFHIRKVFPLCDWWTILNSYHFRYRLTWCWIKSMISKLFIFINLIILLNIVVVDSQTFKNLQIQLQIYLGSICIRTWGPLSHGIHILWLVEKPEVIQDYFTLDHEGPKNGWKTYMTSYMVASGKCLMAYRILR